MCYTVAMTSKKKKKVILDSLDLEENQGIDIGLIDISSENSK